MGWRALRRLMTTAVAAALLTACGGSGETKSNGQASAGGKPGSGGAVACKDGAERCPCYGNGTCNKGLTCASHLCVLVPSAGGAGNAGGGGMDIGGAADSGVDIGGAADSGMAGSGGASGFG